MLKRMRWIHYSSVALRARKPEGHVWGCTQIYNFDRTALPLLRMVASGFLVLTIVYQYLMLSDTVASLVHAGSMILGCAVLPQCHVLRVMNILCPEADMNWLTHT